jgi:LysR family transcriptional regulator, hydrogen peroxide-inducible genes activator
MNLRALKYLVAIAEQRHFGKAAIKCFVSQPTLSMQIKKLEEELGVQLLERTNKSVLLTEVGAILAEHAKSILQQIDEILNIAKSVKDPYGGELKLGLFPTLGPYLLPLIIPDLSKAFPRLKLYLIEEKTPSLIEKLHHGKLDAAVLALPIEALNFKATPLFDEEFILTVQNDHPFAKRKSIRQNDLENKNLLLLEDGHCLRDQALALCHKNKASEVKGFQATSLETLRHMVAVGVGITLMPKLACYPNENITYIPFEKEKPSRTIGILWRKSSAKEKLLMELTHQIKKIIAAANTLGMAAHSG